MADERDTPSDAARERYTLRENPAFDVELAQRTATNAADFFLPHLRPGMRLLDVGCGPGSITLGLAQALAPGEVVGIDLRPEPLAQARADASERGIANVRFQVASAYELPYPDDSFDAAYARNVLMHLREPIRALAEMRRVLRPGGVVGVRDPDFSAQLVYPLTPVWEAFIALRDRVYQHNGGHPFVGRAHRQLLRQAGFTGAEAGATVRAAGTLPETRSTAAFLRATWQGIAQTALDEGWTDRESLEAMRAEFDAWAERPDAFYAAVSCHAVGRVEE